MSEWDYYFIMQVIQVSEQSYSAPKVHFWQNQLQLSVEFAVLIS